MPTTPFAISTQQVLRLVKERDRVPLTRETVAFWHRQGIAPASYPCTNGPKSGVHYSLTDVARVRLVARLRHAGLSLQRVRLIFARLSDHELTRVLKPGSKAVLVIDGNRGVIVKEPGRPDRELPSGQLRFELEDVVVPREIAKKYAA